MASITITLLLILDRIVLVSFPPIIPMLPLGGVEGISGCYHRALEASMAPIYSVRIRLVVLMSLVFSGLILSAPPSDSNKG